MTSSLVYQVTCKYLWHAFFMCSLLLEEKGMQQS